MAASSLGVNEPKTLDTTAAGSHGPVPIRWYHPGESGLTAPAPTIVWAHGGGFFAGGLDQPEAHDVARALTRRGLTVVTVDYRLAPLPGLSWASGRERRSRARFPLPLDDVFTAFRTVSRQGPGGVILGGASAGACLAAAATLRALDMELDPKGVVLAYGFFHSSHPRSREIQRRVRGHRRLTHSRWPLDVVNRNYAGSQLALADRFAFPGGHDLAGFPPTLMINADRDAMRASGDQFAVELMSAGVDVEHHVLHGAAHAFLNRPRLDAFTTAIELIASWSCRDERRTRGSGS